MVSNENEICKPNQVNQDIMWTVILLTKMSNYIWL